MFDYTLIVKGSVAMCQGISAGTAEVGQVRLLPIQPGDEVEVDADHHDQPMLKDNVERPRQREDFPQSGTNALDFFQGGGPVVYGLAAWRIFS